MTNIDDALKAAEEIKNAVVGKFPKYEGYVRRYAANDSQSGYIEIALRPQNTGSAQERAVGYADEFFTSINSIEDKKAKAKMIFNDFKGLLIGS